MTNIKSKIYPTAMIAVIYGCAFMVAWYIFPKLPFTSTMLNVLTADIAATGVIFAFSMIFKNSSVYDPYWSIAPPVIVIYLINLFPQGNSTRQCIILILVLFWSMRLTVNWIRGWHGFRHQDWRYTSIAQKTGKWYWPVSFLGIHFMPTLLVFMGCLPFWYSLSNPSPFNILDIPAVLFTLSAILVEWIADEQLLRFRKSNITNATIRSGIWNYTRHPNYLGEICYWGGLFLFVVAASGLTNSSGYWTVAGLIAMILLFTFISIPIMEKRNITRKSGYKEYMTDVPALLPRIHFLKK